MANQPGWPPRQQTFYSDFGTQTTWFRPVWEFVHPGFHTSNEGFIAERVSPGRWVLTLHGDEISTHRSLSTLKRTAANLSYRAFLEEIRGD